jgi:4-aminobutyrate aminotransferase-like enzyme
VRVIPAPDSHRAPAGQLADVFAADVAAAIADFARTGVKLSALIVDSIFSSDGVCADPPGFLRAAVDVVHRADGVFIADEVQPGFGRTGTAMWGFERHGVRPDIVTLGKPMGNGYPIGAAVTRPEILETLCRGVGYFNTFGGSPVAAAVGLAVLDVLKDEGLLDNAVTVGGRLKQSIAALAARHPAIGNVRGAGFYLGIELLEPGIAVPDAGLATRVINAMRRRRVLIGAAGRHGNVLKLRPPLCFSAANADQLVAVLDEALAEAARDDR